MSGLNPYAEAVEVAALFWAAIFSQQGAWSDQPESTQRRVVDGMIVVLDAYDDMKAAAKPTAEYEGGGTTKTAEGALEPKGLGERLDRGDPLTQDEQGRVRVALAARILAIAVACEESARASDTGRRASLYKVAIDGYEAVADLVSPNPIEAQFRAALLPPYLARRLPGNFDKLPRLTQIRELERVGR